MLLEISGMVVLPGEGEETLPQKVAAILCLPVDDMESFKIRRRSIDARRRRPPRFVYVIEVSLPDGSTLPAEPPQGVTIRPVRERRPPLFARIAGAFRDRPVVIGSGPAGLFAALTLAERGTPPLLLERGKGVAERVGDVHRFWREGRLDPDSHVHFGEGGAGTFSDGKLTSRTKNPDTGWVKQVLVEMGAPANILTDARPHIGTDRLRSAVVHLRERLIALGCDVRFGAKVTDFLLDRNRVAGIVVNHREEIRTKHLILAIGQSADDTYRRLQEIGVQLEPKAFAMGLRVEHPQQFINEIQYGKDYQHPELPPADYFLTARIKSMNRSVYTFCMCPGGQVIGCSAEAGGVITNGMSDCRRDGFYANSAVVVNVLVEDFPGAHPLSGLDFRRMWEEKAFLQGGGAYRAPAQRLIDFLNGRDAGSIGATSYLPGVRSAALRHVLPPFAAEAIKEGFRQFDLKMPGFIHAEAHLIGVETRTSAPVRILRRSDGQSMNTIGLYPCGEGAGYAGGIISSALDGIRIARNVA